MSDFNIEQMYTSTLEKINTTREQSCISILPYPKEYMLPKISEPKEIPSIFRINNYKQKLDNTTCSAVYSQYNTLALHEAMDSGRVIKPKFLVAPMKTSITFFEKDHSTPFSISKEEFDTIEAQSSKLPAYFNWIQMNDNISKPFNQGLCGSCWAVAVATCLSDVFVVSKKVESNPNLSITHILSCFPQSQCDGGDPSQAVFDVSKNGIVTAECLDYSWCTDSACSGDPLKHFGSKNVNQYIPECKCATSSSNPTKYFVGESLSICIPPKLEHFTAIEQRDIRYFLQNMYGNVDSTKLDLSKQSNKSIQDMIKYHIYTYGPVIGGFHVFKNFFRGDYHETNDIYVETVSYSGVPGIDYSDLERDWVGSHAVVVVGWGKDNVNGESVDYWVVRNSWGKGWGNRGIFKMAMYGDDPNKKYQNRASQFEYPSIISGEQGIGITGGMIIMKAGTIEHNSVSSQEQEKPAEQPAEQPTEQPTEEDVKDPLKHKRNGDTVYSSLAFILFVAFLIVLYYIFRQNKESWIIISETILLIIVFSTLISLLPK